MLLMHKPNSEDLSRMYGFYEAGRVVPVIDRCYKLAEVPDAFKYFGEGKPKGKVVIVVDEAEVPS